ncbi:alpha/beta fold hydrolase [Herbidospora daliensis]|uniref:alpha/beta fold hydrolase n=1 Tax=Herbidospora daliensis TaxID=295585 RepID=UPI0007859FB2|nr:alpha/beta fold hydrolase [Herbidospora daliensis]
MLNVREWGTGPKTAVLIHGILSDSGCWWRVGPDLAARGYRVVAVDLPGHGRSAPMPDATVERMAEAVRLAVPAEVDLAVAHSMGSFILGAALSPDRVVHVDAPTGAGHRMPAEAWRGTYEKAKSRRTLEALAEKHPGWDAFDREAEAEAAKLFDVETAVALLVASGGVDHTPGRRGLVIRAEGSRFVPEETPGAVTIEGADHHVWYGHHDEFMAAVCDFGDQKNSPANPVDGGEQ